MTPEPPASLRRLARANPLPADQVRTDQARTQAVLEQILATPRPGSTRRRPRRSRRFAGIAAVALLVTAGGAFAATDPFGFWHSSSPGTAMYQLDPSHHARPVAIRRIGCLPADGGGFRCGAHVRGTRYEFVDRIAAPGSVNRAKLLAGLRGSGMSETVRHRLASDLAAVPDSFLANFAMALRFGTYGSDGMVPPPGVPAWLACEPAGAAIACRDLNGDEHTPVGSSIYMAMEGPGWRRAPAGTQPDAAANTRLMNTLFGRMTPAESRLLRDFLTVATVGGGSSGPTRAPAPSKGG